MSAEEPAVMARIGLAPLLAAALALAPAPLSAQAPFTVGPVTAPPGTVASGVLEIAPEPGDEGTSIPFTIVHGSKRGPVLALIAGTHGMEYPPILALQRAASALSPRDLSGTVVLVHVANMPSFLGRTIYYSPVDRKNLNRVFPGKADGTISERIAFTLTREIVDRATHVVDIHCGDGNEWLRPYTYWVTTGAPDVARVGREMALAFGMDHIVIDMERPADPTMSVYLSNTAILKGKPALTVESGGLGRTDEASIGRIEQGVAGVMKYLGMTTEGPPPVEHPVWIGRGEVLRSSHSGVLYPQVEPGSTVAAGTLLAYVTDFHGKRVEEIRAPFDGEVLYVVATPPINKGEPVVFVGERTPAPPAR